MEHTDSPSYGNLPNVDAFHYTISKTSINITTNLIRKVFTYWIKLMVADKSFPKFKFSLDKSEGERQIPYDNTYMVEFKIRHRWTYLQNRNRLTDIENRPVVTKVGEVEEGRSGSLGISRCKLLYIGWMNNKVLLYSTGNYIQYPVINHNGKEYEIDCIYICITESLCCTAEINTTLSINYASIT